MEKSFKELLHASFKSEDTEEWLDVHFTRPIGLAFALLWKKLGVHPNTITILSFFLGAGAGWMFWHEDIKHNIAGIVLLMFANFCDSTDGQLARLTGQKTLLGRVLDGFSADVWFFAIYLGISLRLCGQPIPFTNLNWGLLIFIICAVAGFVCHARQCALSDYYRQIHLFFLLGKEGSELDNSKEQWAIFHSIPAKLGNWFPRLFYYNYAKYCSGQERRTPQFQRFFANVKAKYPTAESIPQSLRNDFRRESLPLMKYTNILTFNTRAITLCAACLLNVPYVYPLVEIVVLSALCHYMWRRHEALCAKLDTKYNR